MNSKEAVCAGRNVLGKEYNRTINYEKLLKDKQTAYVHVLCSKVLHKEA